MFKPVVSDELRTKVYFFGLALAVLATFLIGIAILLPPGVALWVTVIIASALSAQGVLSNALAVQNVPAREVQEEQARHAQQITVEGDPEEIVAWLSAGQEALAEQADATPVGFVQH